MNEFQSATVIIALLAEEAGVGEDELATITVIAFATRLLIARARRATQYRCNATGCEDPCLDGGQHCEFHREAARKMREARS
jgi:hypothetical protein